MRRLPTSSCWRRSLVTAHPRRSAPLPAVSNAHAVAPATALLSSCCFATSNTRTAVVNPRQQSETIPPIHRSLSNSPRYTSNVTENHGGEFLSSFQTTRDKFGRHRRLTPSCVNNPNADATTKALLAEYRIESNMTMNKIEQKLVDRFGIDRSVLVREIQESAALQTQAESAEIGPSGLYSYYAEDNGGIRTFIRVPNNRKDTNDGSDGFEEVLKINHHVELPGPMTLSADEKYVARISMPSTFGGGAANRIIIRHIASGTEHAILAPYAHNITFGPSYVGDDGGKMYHLYYTTSNELLRPDSVYRVPYSASDGFASSGEHELLLHDTNEANHVDVSISKGKRWIVMQSTSKSSNEVHLIGPPAESEANISGAGVTGTRCPILVRKREEGVLYYVECGNSSDDIFILAHFMNGGLNTSGGRSSLGEEMTLFQTRVQDLPLENFCSCRVLATSDHSHFIEEMDLFDAYIVLYERSVDDGIQRIRILNRKSTDLDEVSSLVPLFQELNDCVTVTPGGNAWYESTCLAFSVETPVDPPTMCSFDMNEGALDSNVTNHTPDVLYSRVFATSLDATEVPMTLIGKKDDTEPGTSFGRKRPTVLVAYGCYGEMNNISFDFTIAPLIKRGFVIAYAHTRGGGELGRSWYCKGRGCDKERAIEDYLACAEALVGDLCIAGEGQLAAKAFSAGGVLAASAVNNSPQLFSAMSLINPFVDVSGSMVDASLPLTEHERDEWGDPLNDDRAEAIIKGYCPFANIRSQAYPPTFLVGTIDDQSVPYWHAITYAMKRKEMMIRMREDTVDDQLSSLAGENGDVLLQIEEHGGHNLHSRRLDVASLECAFLLGELSSPRRSAVYADGNKSKKLSLLGALWSMVK